MSPKVIKKHNHPGKSNGLTDDLSPFLPIKPHLLDKVIVDANCKWDNRDPNKSPPRPPNGFIVWRSYCWALVKELPDADRNNRTLSKTTGEIWRSLPAHTRLPFERAAKTLKQAHTARFPGYTYRPRSGGSKAVKPIPKTSKALAKSRRTRGKKGPQLQGTKRVTYGLDEEYVPGQPDLIPPTPLPSPQLSSSSFPSSPTSSRCSSPSVPSTDQDDYVDDSSDDTSDGHSEVGTPQSSDEELWESMQGMELTSSPRFDPSMELMPGNPDSPFFKSSALLHIGDATLVEAATNYRSLPCFSMFGDALDLSTSSSPPTSYTPLLSSPQGTPIDIEIPSLSQEEIDVEWNEWLNEDVISRDGN